MIVVISGASGFIGSALTRAFRQRGDEVRPPVRRPARSSAEVSWNIDQGTIEAEKLERIDAVVHLAGENLAQRWTDSARRRIRDSRVNGTKLVARTLASLSSPPKVLLSGSAIGIYGSRRGDEVLDESSSCGDDFLASVCKEWEAASEPVRAAGLRVINLRTGLVLGPNGGMLSKMLTPFRLGLGGKMGDGAQWMSWIALEDYVGLVLFCLERSDVAGPVNLTAPDPVTNETFTHALGKALSRPTVFSVPKTALELLLGKMAEETVLASQRVMPARARSAGFRFTRETVSEALRAALGR